MRSRLGIVLVGAGLVLAAPSSQAATTPQSPAPQSPAPQSPALQSEALAEQEAMALLRTASRAGRELTYAGTQFVATWAPNGAGSSDLVEVAHDAARGSVLPADAATSGTTAALDPRLLELLAVSYDLTVAAPGRCTGRRTHVVEAHRPGGLLAGRFWIDTDSGLLLRREAFDGQGLRMRSSAFLDVEVTGASRSLPESAPRSADADSIAALRAQGWQVPESLPDGFTLFDTRLSSPVPGKHVLHLAYSDGLSTLSLFAQRGRLGTDPPAGFVAEQVADRPVWVRREVPERVVWGGAGRVWTVVSDASPRTVRAAVAALPRDAAPRDGVLTRVGRGLGRIAGMVNPFG